MNLGNPREMTVLDFAKTVQRLTGGASEIVFVSPKDERTKDDPNIRQPDITRARADSRAGNPRSASKTVCSARSTISATLFAAEAA